MMVIDDISHLLLAVSALSAMVFWLLFFGWSIAHDTPPAMPKSRANFEEA